MNRRAAHVPPADLEDRTHAYLVGLGERTRRLREQRGMSRRVLARDSGVSERYISQVEMGRANISISLLRDLAKALGTPLEHLASEECAAEPDLAQSVELLRGLHGADLKRAWRLLSERFGGADAALRRRRVALIGLKGAGKSSLGVALARRLNVRFVELDQLIEDEAGTPLGTIFELYGQGAFRRFERRCLERVVRDQTDFVVAVGGGAVAEPATFEFLRSSCFTIWVRASPEAHMERVIRQGDLRPMADAREAMSDLREILRMREPLYRHADAEIDTTGRDIDEATLEVLGLIQSQEPSFVS